MTDKFCITCGYNFNCDESFWERIELPFGNLPIIGIELCPKCCPKEWSPLNDPNYFFRKIDKSSSTYFMTKMTQEEFENKCKDKKTIKYEFNKIKSVKSFKKSIE